MSTWNESVAKLAAHETATSSLVDTANAPPAIGWWTVNPTETMHRESTSAGETYVSEDEYRKNGTVRHDDIWPVKS